MSLRNAFDALATETTAAAIQAAAEAAAGGIFPEDSAHVSGDKGRLALGIRWDSDAPTADNGDYTALKLDEAGRLKVATQPASVPPVTGSITANGGAVAIECKRFANISISMVATSLVGHNASFQCSNNSTDGTNGTWYAVQAVRSNANTVEIATGALTATPAYMWHVNVGDYSWFRVRATAHTSGTAAYIIRPGAFATEPIPGAQVTGTQPISGSVTATPPTPTASNISSAATTNATAIKASAGTLYSIVASNTGAAAAFVKLYNKASAPTVGTDIPVLTITVPAGGTVAIHFGTTGHRFTTGIALAITNLAADSDTTAVAAAQVKVLSAYV